MPQPHNIVIALIALNLIAFALFGIDKALSRRAKGRIPERTLMIICALAASLGGLFGMVIFNHKTSKALFRYGVPMLALIHAGAGYWLSYG